MATRLEARFRPGARPPGVRGARGVPPSVPHLTVGHLRAETAPFASVSSARGRWPAQFSKCSLEEEVAHELATR